MTTSTRTPGRFATVRQIRGAAAESAHSQHWFSESTIAFFSSRIEQEVHGGTYFVTSEQGPDGIRRWSVRSATDDGEIDTVGEFGEHASSSEAHAAAAQYAVGLR